MNISNEFERKIRKLYDAQTAARIKSLIQLKDGQNLVGCNLDTFKKLNYPLQNPLLLHELKKDDEVIILYDAKIV
jgi:hypothetical protein